MLRLPELDCLAILEDVLLLTEHLHSRGCVHNECAPGLLSQHEQCSTGLSSAALTYARHP